MSSPVFNSSHFPKFWSSCWVVNCSVQAKKKIVVVLNELQDFQLIILIGLLKSRKANLVTSRWC